MRLARWAGMFVDNSILDAILRGAVLIAIGLVWVTLVIRLTGLRSLSKMTNFDFVMTVALGSLLAGAGQVTKWTDFLQVLAAVAGLFIAQFVAARLRKDSDAIENAMQNEPVLLMKDGEFLRDAMKAARVAESDIRAKLREANVMAMEEVCAVVLETTGDVSVLHGESVDEALLEGVREGD